MVTRITLSLGVSALCIATSMTAHAAEYFVDPDAEVAGDGSESSPWVSLQRAIDEGNIPAGDTVWLMSGQYGDLRIDSVRNPLTMTIAAAEGEEPVFTSVLVRDSTALALRGLHVRGEKAGFLIDLNGSNEDVHVEGCALMSAPDTSTWSAQDWITRASSGIGVSGTRMTIRKNLLKNVAHGIDVGADNSLVEGNLIENFSRDGMRGLGDFTVFQYNTVKNSYSVDDHHDDGFQSWSRGDGGVGTGEVVGVVLRGNTFINYEDPNQPHRGPMQGIGCFDGTFVDWVIENNVVVTDHWHGITVLGARNTKIVNNTVIGLNEEQPGPPWISIDQHKDGTLPTDCVVRNNLTTALNNSNQVLEENNITFAMDEAQALFLDPGNLDFHLLEAAPAVDAGSATDAPGVDRDLIPRPQGRGIDVGAYEWHDGSVEPSGNPEDSSGTGGGVLGEGASTSPGDTGPSSTGSSGGCSSGRAVGGNTPSIAGVLLLLSLVWRARQRASCTAFG